MTDRADDETRTEEAGEARTSSPAGAGPLQPAVRVIMMPKDTNALGTIFGGIILSHIDLAGMVEASRHVAGRFVTVAMREVEFHAPVQVGDLVSFFTSTQEVGRTSITVRVDVQAERRGAGSKRVQVTEAEVVYVHVNAENRPVPIYPEDREPPATSTVSGDSGEASAAGSSGGGSSPS